MVKVTINRYGRSAPNKDIGMENRAFRMLNSKEKNFITDLSFKENITVDTTINRILRVSIGFIILSLLLTAIGVYVFVSGNSDIYGFIFAWFVVMFLIVVLTPIKIGVKILIGRFK